MQCEKKQDRAMHAAGAFRQAFVKITTVLTGVITQNTL